MKKIILTTLLLFAVTLTYSQKKVTSMTEANTAEMVKVLKLNADQEAAVYKIHLTKNEQLAANKEDKSLSKEQVKANQKAIFKTAQNEFRTLLGKEKVKEWNTYKNAQKKAKNNR